MRFTVPMYETPRVEPVKLVSLITLVTGPIHRNNKSQIGWWPTWLYSTYLNYSRICRISLLFSDFIFPAVA